MNLSGEVTIQASADRVWAIVGTEFAHVGEWATAVEASGPDGAPQPAPGCPALPGRICETRVSVFPTVSERIVAYDDVERTLTYVATGLPRFVGDARNRWHVRVAGPQQAHARFDAVLETAGLAGRLVAVPLRVRMRWETRRVLEDLKHYAEHATPSPSKQRRLARRGSGPASASAGSQGGRVPA